MFLNFEGLFGLGHIIFLVLSLIIMVSSIVLINKFKPNDKNKEIIIKSLGLLLFVFIVTNRIVVTYSDVVVNKRIGYTWLNIIPNTFCGFSSLVLSLAVLLGKKNNNVLHFIVYLGFLGGLITLLYPDFLETQAFFDIRSITGLLHHTTMLYLCIMLVYLEYMTPELKKWKLYPIGLAFMMLFGIFLKDAFGFTKAMQIGEPLLKSLPVLTSWYILLVIDMVLFFSFLFSYEKLHNHKSFKESLKDLK